jgi:hypothetical protein
VIYAGHCDLGEARIGALRHAGRSGRVRNERIEVQRLSADLEQAHVIYHADIAGGDYPGSFDHYQAELTREPIPLLDGQQYIAELTARIESEQQP